MASYKERTAPQPHKVIKEMSLFLGKFEPQPKNAGWAFQKNLADGTGYIRVTSIQKVNAHDGKMFDFVMSNLFAQRKYLFEVSKGKLMDDIQNVDTASAYEAIAIDMTEILKFRGMKNRTENKRAILNSLKNMVGMTVEVKNSKSSLVYSVLTSVKVDEVNSNVLYVKVNEEINQAFYQAGMRFINVERALPLRSDIAVEFTRFLQVRGGGIRGNKPMSPKMLEHNDVIYFLHLEDLDEHSQIKTIRRAITAVGKQGFDTYTMKRYATGVKWLKDIKLNT